MAAKSFSVTTTTAQTVYAICRRDADGYLLKASDGTFATGLTATQAAAILTEDSLLKGLYEDSENRVPWNDGSYTVVYYAEASPGTVDPAADSLIASGEFYVSSDSEITLSQILNDIAAIDADTALILADTAALIDVLDPLPFTTSTGESVDSQDLLKYIKLNYKDLTDAIQDIRALKSRIESMREDSKKRR